MSSDQTTALRQRLERLAELKGVYRALKKEADEAKREYEEYQAALYADMQEAGIASLRSADGLIFSARQTAYATVQDRARFHEWVREQGLEDVMLKTREESAVLNEAVREALANNTDLPPGLGWYPREYISIA